MRADGPGAGAAAAMLWTIITAGVMAGMAPGTVLAQPAQGAAPADEPPAEETAPAGESEAPNTDESAADLNARQQIKQSYTFTRTVNGEVVGAEERSVTYSPSDPLRPSEAAASPVEQLRADFDRELLTRSEAFEEARLDFALADQVRDGSMTAEEFVYLVESWRENPERRTPEPALDEETAREREYRAFVAELDPEAARMETEERARRKFAYMTGAAASLSREDYIQEYLLDFDAMDEDENMMLKGEELIRFRALNRGETIE